VAQGERQQGLLRHRHELGGQSGRPVFRIVNGKRIGGVAVHAYGGNSTNSGTRINAKVHARMTSWMS
jgi:V8-like Glu-specific endopeptidase